MPVVIFVGRRDRWVPPETSVAFFDALAPSLSADWRFVAFKSFANDLVPGDTNGAWDIFVRDRQTGTTQRVSVNSGGAQGDGDAR